MLKKMHQHTKITVPAILAITMVSVLAYVQHSIVDANHQIMALLVKRKLANVKSTSTVVQQTV